jgi:hypothetical protein
VINIADMTPIGANWGSEVSGYILYTDSAGGTPYGVGLTVERAPFFVNNKTPVVYQFTATVPSGTPLFLSVKPAAADDVSDPGPQSNVATVVIDPGPPAAPTSLQPTADATVGVGNVKLDWTASTSTDVEAYEVWIKKTSEDALAWTLNYDSVPATQYTYTVTGLSIESWDFYVVARDFTDQSSDPSNVATATPFAVPPPDPPANVTAVPSQSQGQAIDVKWDTETGIQGYKVYRKGPGDPDFSMVNQIANPMNNQYTDGGLTVGQTYEYYVTSYSSGGSLESGPSNTASCKPSDIPPISITNLTTDKTTHYKGGGEPASNITVTADQTPDSVDWSATQGSVTGTGTSVTWSPPGGASAGTVTITCTVHKGPNSDSATLKLYVVSESIKTGLPCGGNITDFNSYDLLEPLDLGGNIITDPKRPFFWFADGQHVVLFNRFETW